MDKIIEAALAVSSLALALFGLAVCIDVVGVICHGIKIWSC